MLGIYLHVPFCLRRCGYCDFCSSVADEAAMSAYTDALCREISASEGAGEKADTIYFGGGTPSLLDVKKIEKILSAVRQKFDISSDCEITLEANPGTISPEKAAGYFSLGINRVSLGVQSCKDDELYRLGRIHNFSDALEAIKTVRRSGIENISCDLMIGIPGQTRSTLRESAAAISSLEIEHISAYMLKIEEGTPFDCDSVRRLCADDDTVSDMYLDAVEILSQSGFVQYEISNFSRPGFRSRHNYKYWTGEQYLGFGLSAHSFYRGKRFYNPSDVGGYINGGSPRRLSEDDCPNPLLEYILLGLRLCEGISLYRLAELGGSPGGLSDAAKKFADAGFLTASGDRIALTPKGFLVSNGIISELIDSQNL